MMKIWKILLATLLLLPGYAGAESEPATNEENEAMTISLDSPYDFDETVQTLRSVIEAHNFRTFPDRFLEQGLIDELSVNQRQLSIRFCNFNKLYEALKMEPRLGVLLPCAITVMENEDGDVKLVTANIKAMSRLFDNDQISDLMTELQDSYEAILEEVTF
uniref:Cytochrome c n=1 Tax=uncultured Thiotrichaceae bacterium TaxID=298394 RepID=A0A6S6UK34_9GAMM|nr:MAG: Putative cytochrome c [uncultured Thiotrichaceae bacterium]